MNIQMNQYFIEQGLLYILTILTRVEIVAQNVF